MRSQLSEGSEIKQALAKAEEFARKAALAKTANLGGSRSTRAVRSLSPILGVRRDCRVRSI